MNSKIIKISFVLVFILIAMGFFNSAFAYGLYIYDSPDYPNEDYPTSNAYNWASDNSQSINSFKFVNFCINNDLSNPVYNGQLDLNNLPISNTDSEYYSIFQQAVSDYNNGLDVTCFYSGWNKLFVIPYVDGNEYFYPVKVGNYYYLGSSTGSLLIIDIGVNKNTHAVSASINTYVSTNAYVNYNFNSYSVNHLYCNLGSYTIKDYQGNVWFSTKPDNTPSIDINVVQTGTSTGQVEFTPINWESHMYYVKGNMDELVRLIAEEELSPIHNQVRHYDGPIAIEHGEYVMGMLFDNESNMIFSEISDTVFINYNTLLDSSHKLYIDKENENTYYLSIHNYQNGDYLKICDRPITDGSFSTHVKTLSSSSATLSYNGLFIGQAYETALHHINRKINLSQNGITYFYLYDSNDNLINSVVLNSSNYYSGEDFNFDVELEYGSSLNDNLHLISDNIRWVKITPIISVPSIDKYELYLRISDYGNIPYNNEEDRLIFATHDTDGSNHIGIGIGTDSNMNWFRIDDKIYDYFYLNTSTYDTNFTFELQLRSASGQIIQTKTFNVSLSNNNKSNGTITSYTDGNNDTYVRNSNELSNISQNASNFNFNGLNNLSELDLRDNLDGLIDNSVGFFGLLTTLFLLLPTWISTLLYFFFFGIIVITLFRFIRGA